jgi:hypothetical protein
MLIADNKGNLQRLLYQFMISCQKYNMKTSANKTKTMMCVKNLVDVSWRYEVKMHCI